MFMRSDAYGDDEYFPTYDTSCYREEKIVTVKNMHGDEVTSTTRLYFDGLLNVTGHDLMIIDEREWPVQAVSRFPGLKPGTGTTVVYL
jgi:hypothetical protein